MIYNTLHRKLSQRRTDNTMTYRKRRSNDLQNNTQKTKSTKDRQYNDQKGKGEAMIYNTLHRKLNQRRTDNKMTKRKRRSNDMQNTTQKTKSKKDRHYNDQKKTEKQ
jgi:hypothetical protein